ncbi:MAG: type II toxin-antitoxin system PemK/MazF family toxin [Bifidobacteriaceae bacterium]|jgi:mRNA interferase MazF|nr:type II toxin-antitoxin system PemK/MazF family toxin [Bifidobacteriaceae bacterium]
MRGEIWVARADLYATKVRPVLLIGSDEHDVYGSVITCLITTHQHPNAAARVQIDPSPLNGLKDVSFVMTDKIFSFDKSDLDRRVGALAEADLGRVSRKLRAILGL